MNNRNRHIAPKTETVGSMSASGVQFVAVKLQWTKEDIAYSLHAAPGSYSTAGIQTTDFLNYLGFMRGGCAFVPRQECYSRWIPPAFDLEGFGKAFGEAFNRLREAERLLNDCGFFFDQPEGWEYFTGKPTVVRGRPWSYLSGDGHTFAQSETLKMSEDQVFLFALSWSTGVNIKGWTFHYRPKHPPVSPEILAAFAFLKLETFKNCPLFDFEECCWKFIPFEKRGDSDLDTNADFVHQVFDAHAKNFSAGIEQMVSAQGAILPFEMHFLNIRKEEHDLSTDEKAPRRKKPESRASKLIRIAEEILYDYDVTISFAGAQRGYAERLASMVRNRGFMVFYDEFYPERLWGRDLAVFFDEVYGRRSKYCVIFISKEYVEGVWTRHEARSALARAIKEKGQEYILPIKVDDSELPGLASTVSYLSLQKYKIEEIAELLIKKLGGST